MLKITSSFSGFKIPQIYQKTDQQGVAKIGLVTIVVVVILLVVVLLAIVTLSPKRERKVQRVPKAAQEPGLVRSEKTLVSGFPVKNLPQVRGAALKDSTKLTEGTKTAYTANWTVPGDVPEIMTEYLSQLEGNGWVIEGEANLTDKAQRSAQLKKQGVLLNLIVDQEQVQQEGVVEVHLEIPLQEIQGEV